MTELDRRIELEALITEREAMIAFNTSSPGNSNYGADLFFEIADKMRKLGESSSGRMPVSKTGSDGSIPSSPAMTDEEAVAILAERGKVNKIMKHASEDNEHGPTYWDEKDDAALAHIRARLSQKPKVTREQRDRIRKTLTHFFDSATYTREQALSAILAILGLEVEDN